MFDIFYIECGGIIAFSAVKILSGFSSKYFERRCSSMNKSSSIMNPNARDAMNRFKMEAAGDLDVAATY